MLHTFLAILVSPCLISRPDLVSAHLTFSLDVCFVLVPTTPTVTTWTPDPASGTRMGAVAAHISWGVDCEAITINPWVADIGRLEKQALSREHQQGGYLKGTFRDTLQVGFWGCGFSGCTPSEDSHPHSAYSQSAALTPSSRLSVPGRASDWPSYCHAHAYLLEDVWHAAPWWGMGSPQEKRV